MQTYIINDVLKKIYKSPEHTLSPMFTTVKKKKNHVYINFLLKLTLWFNLPWFYLEVELPRQVADAFFFFFFTSRCKQMNITRKQWTWYNFGHPVKLQINKTAYVYLADICLTEVTFVMLIPPNPATDCRDSKNTKTSVVHRLQLVSVCPVIILMTSSL